ncbi:MAG: tetratricopeptide repeat protein [Planctomycetota bacterium]
MTRLGRGTHGMVRAIRAVALVAVLGLVGVAAADDLGQAYDVYAAGDYAAALPMFERIGQTGDPEAQYMVGLMYHRGRGTEVDGLRAAQWYAQAANQNHPAALTNLGILHRDGVGVEQDMQTALDLLRRGAYLDNSFAQLAYGAAMMNEAQNDADYIEGAAMMQVAAENGNEIAQQNIAGWRHREERARAINAKQVEVREMIDKIVAFSEAQRQQREQQQPDQPANPGGDGADEPQSRGPAPGRTPSPADPAVATANPSASSTDQMLFQQTTLNDAKWRGNPSHTLLVPEGWRVEGGAFWFPPQLYATMPSQDLKVIGPQGQQLHVMPNGVAVDKRFPPGLNMPQPQQGQVDDGYQVVFMPRSPEEWTRFVTELVVPGHRPGATNVRVTKQEIEPVLTTLMKRQLQPLVQNLNALNQQNRASGLNMQSSADTSFLTFDVTYDQDGQSWREMIGLGAGFVYNVSDVGFGPSESTTWWIEPALSFRAPQGVSLEEQMPMLMVVANSLQMTPQWFQMREELRAKAMKTNRNISQDRINTSRKISQINAQTSRVINDIYNQMNQNREISSDRNQREFIEYVREVETWSTGDGNAVQLPGGFNNAFSNGQGGFLVTNGSSAPAGWTQLQRAQ